MFLRWIPIFLMLVPAIFISCNGSGPSPTPSPTPTTTGRAAQPPAATSAPSQTPLTTTGAAHTPTATSGLASTPTATLAIAGATPSPTPTIPIPTTVPGDNLEDATGVVPLVFLPMDEAPHDVPVEWWYFNGHLTDADGASYSFHFVGFKVVGIELVGQSSDVKARFMHLTLATPDEGVAVKSERLALGIQGKPPQGFAISVDDWSIRGANQHYSLDAAEGGYGFSLELEDTKKPVLHRGTGLLDMGPAGESFYYSRTRLKAEGVLTIDGATREVWGEGWMDQQWGDFSTAQVGWDWFSIQMDDNTELMAFLLWGAGTSPREMFRVAGTYILADGSAQDLQWDDIEVTPLGSWTSPNTGTTYPMGWEIRVLPLSMDLILEPDHLDAEFSAGRIGTPMYWEGAVTVSGERDGQAVSGRGFVEMVGYDR